MAEPQPEGVHEGAGTPPPPTGERGNVAQSMSNLDAAGDGEQKKEVDTKALGEAMKNLNVEGTKGEVKAEEKKKVVGKIEQADVGLLVSEFDLTKPKATELLRAHDGNALKAIIAFISAPA